MNRTVAGLAACLVLAAGTDCRAAEGGNESETGIKAFCIDFNWGPGGPNGFAAPGLWADADPAEHVAWYKGLGVNVIQTFCVSCNGYAWYKGGVVPEQPGLEHDFLTEVVRLGHKEGMKVMGYFCVGANTRWAQEHPDQSYGNPSHTHIPFTTEYGDYLCGAAADALTRTGCNGFMVDWFFNGPDCVIWLSCHDLGHPQLAGSRVFEEVDWLMNEAGDLESIERTRKMAGEHTQLVACVVGWGDRHNAPALTTAAKAAGIGVYGFSRPGADSLPLSIEAYLAKPIDAFTGNDRNIAALARWYNGLPFDVVKNSEGRLGDAVPKAMESGDR